MAKRSAISIPVNGAEFLELESRAKAAGVTVPAYVRIQCSFEGWSARGREMEGRGHVSTARPVRLALERRSVTIRVTEEEYAELDRQATAAGASVPQHIRTKCGFAVRWTSSPRSEEHDREEDEAWERLKRLGIDPQRYFEEP